MDRKLKRAIDFHGHLGPYLVLGILAGELALKNLGCRKYFNLKVKVRGATIKPKSCLVDGLQLSTGATYGKGNIVKSKGRGIGIEVENMKDKSKVLIVLKKDILSRLDNLTSHKAAEDFAKVLYRANPNNVFDLE
jgi:formylmethanofuran dehydrogenase subunit E